MATAVKGKKQERQQIRKHCEELYVHHNRDFKYLANVYKLPESTIRRWASQDGWENSKKQVDESGWKVMLKLKETLPALIQQLADEPNARNADSLQKVVSALKKLDKDVDIVGTAVMVFKEFSKYIKENDPERADILLDHVEPFIQYLEGKGVYK